MECYQYTQEGANVLFRSTCVFRKEEKYIQAFTSKGRRYGDAQSENATNPSLPVDVLRLVFTPTNYLVQASHSKLAGGMNDFRQDVSQVHQVYTQQVGRGIFLFEVYRFYTVYTYSVCCATLNSPPCLSSRQR